MNIQIIEYKESFSEQVSGLFNEFQDYLVALDPLNRLRRLDGYGDKTLAKILREIEDKDGCLYVAIVDDLVVGFGAAVIERLDDYDLMGVVPSTPGRILELYVSKNSRGNGIGSKIILAIEEYLRDKKCDVIKVGVFAPNSIGRRFYEKKDFEQRDIDSIKK